MANSKLAFLLVITLSFLVVGACDSGAKVLIIEPKSVNFGTVPIHATKSINMKIENRLDSTTTIKSLSISNQPAVVVVNESVLPFDLEVGETMFFALEFTPTTISNIQTNLTITYDSSKTHTVPVMGSGKNAPAIELPEDNYDYCVKLFNTSTDKAFEIKNSGTEDLEISAINLAGTDASQFGIISGDSVPITISAGLSHQVTVSFIPQTDGVFNADIEIWHNADNCSSPTRITLTGTGVLTAPKIEVNQTSPWDLGSTAVGLFSIQTLEISNTGIDPLTIDSISLTTDAEFSIYSVLDANESAVSFPYVCQVSAIIYANIKFEPSALSAFNDTLNIVHNGLYSSSPLELVLNGTGRDFLTKTFNYTGAPEQWTVPANTSSIKVECYGAEGSNLDGYSGGKGGMASAKVPVTPGDTINVYVGGKGVQSVISQTGGWNGGGGTNYVMNIIYSGEGGGASDIRIGGTELTNRIVVGAGGGGAGYNGAGGDGGDLVGSNAIGTDAGFGGTQTDGGTAGGSADKGEFGKGGTGICYYFGGGGGGGGWYGGGGGYDFGGGGGSSYYDAPGNYDTQTQAGVQTDDGVVVISY